MPFVPFALYTVPTEENELCGKKEYLTPPDPNEDLSSPVLSPVSIPVNDDDIITSIVF